MISYNWGSKPIMLKVRDRLKAAGFNVWMDVDNMSKFLTTFSYIEYNSDHADKLY